MKNGNWPDITNEDIRDVSDTGNLYAQILALGFTNAKSEGTKAGLAWRKWWLGILKPEELSIFASRLTQTSAGSSRVGGTILLLGLMAHGREPACEICGASYDPLNPDRTELQVDHVVSWILTRDNRPENLRILCSWHHKMQDTGSSSSMYGFRDSLVSSGE